MEKQLENKDYCKKYHQTNHETYREKDADRKCTARLTLKLLKPKVHKEKALRLKLYRLRKKMAMVKEKKTLEVAIGTGSTNLENSFTSKTVLV